MNVKLLILYGLLAGAVIVLALYFTNTFGLKDAFSSLTFPFFTPSNFSLQGTIDFLTQNWSYLATAATGLTSILAVFRLKAESEAKKTLTSIKESLELDNINLNAELENEKVTADKTIEALASRIKSLEDDTTLEELQKNLSSKLTENQQLNEQLDATNKSLAYVMQQLAQGATTIKDPVTGETIKIVDKIVIK